MSKIIESTHNYTKKQAHELLQCVSNPVYFIEQYCMIQHPVHGVIPFKLNQYRAIIVSNPNGLCNTYAELWYKPKEINGLNHITLEWDECPECDQKFKDNMQACIGMDAWRREYECQFMSSSDMNYNYG